MPRSRAQKAAPQTLERLFEAHPDAHCELDHTSPFQLLVATVLSAQTTDVLVNKITPDLFAKWPTAERLAGADIADIESTINRMGMFRQKSKNISGLAKKLVAEHGGEVPRTLPDLVALPGVGRKTANVVLGVAFGSPEGVVVDTHVQRISQRLGWTKNTTAEKIEQDLMKVFPRDVWDPLSHTLIFHGRRICSAIKPACAACSISDACPSAFKAEHVGRKPPRIRAQAAKKTPAKVLKKSRTTKKAAKKTSRTSATTTRKGPSATRARGKAAPKARRTAR